VRSSLLMAYRLQSKAAEVGFDWKDIKPVFEKVEEELSELRKSLSKGDFDRVAQELGDLLFAVINLARKMSVDPEHALRRAIERFKRRFRYIEEKLTREGRSLKEASLEKMDALWEEAKEMEMGGL